jgi:ribosomal protein S1
VIGYASVERQLLVSAKKADLAQNKVVISAEEAEPGTKLRGTVKAITQRGLLVDLGNELVGFVGAMHALDQPMPNWQKRFHRGTLPFYLFF